MPSTNADDRDPSPGDPSPDGDDSLPSDPSSPSRLRRAGRWLRRLAVLVLAPLLIGAGIVAWALRTESGRAFVLERVAGATYEASGWRLAADDFSLSISPARFEAWNVELRAPGAEPFLALEHGAVDFRWSDLRKDPVVFERTRLRGLVLDLSAPTPERDDEEGEDDDEPTLPFSFPDVAVERGRVLGAPTAEGWIESWSLTDVVLGGSVAADGFESDVESARVRIDRRPEAGADSAASADGEPLAFDLSGRVRGPFLGPYTLERVDLSGEGLELRGSATAGLEENQPLAADFQLFADAGRLLPRLPVLVAPPAPLTAAQAADAGTLRVEGRFDFRALRGDLELHAEALPAAFFEPFVGTETLDRLAARGTTLDADARVALDAGSPEESRGTAEIHWSQDGQGLVDATLRILDSPPPAPGAKPPVHLAVDAEILPGGAGRRHVEAILRAPSWHELGELRAESGRIELRTADLARLRRELAARWPALVDAYLDPSLPLRGALEAGADLRGSLRSPYAEMQARWRPVPGSSLRLQAWGHPLELQGSATVTVESLDLGTFAGLLAQPSETQPSELHPSETQPSERQPSEVQPSELPPRLAGTLDGTLDLVLADTLRAEGDLRVRDLELALAPAAGGRLGAARISAAGQVELERDPTADLSAYLDGATTADLGADLRIEIEDLVPDLTSPGAGPRFVYLASSLRLADAELEIRRLETRLVPPVAEEPAGPPRELSFDADGRLGLVADAPLLSSLVRDGEIRVATDRPDERVERAEVRLRLEEGVIFADLVDLRLPGTAPTVELLAATVPLGSLARAPGLGDLVGALPVAERGEGRITVAFELPRFDTASLYRWLAMEPPAESFRADLEGAFSFHPDDPTGGDGAIELRDVEIELAERTFRSAEVQRLQFVDRKLWLRRARWESRNRYFDVEAEVFLDPSWRFDDTPAEVVASFSAIATGNLEASLLNGYIAGGRAAGLVDVTALAAGTPEDFDAEIDLVGDEDTTFTWLDPYPTFLRAPEVRLVVDGEKMVVEEATATLNEGRLDVEGEVVFDGPVDLRGFLDRVRFRLDYGLTVLVSGNFDLHLPPDGPGVLQSNLLVERGFLRRNVDPDREVLSLLLQPPEIDVEDASDEFRQMQLEVDIATVDGIRVKNNVADLHASWAPLEVTGTLAEPRVRGSIEADPGGKVYAWGQVLRLDRAVLEFQGSNPARLDLVTTSSAQDPSIARGEDALLAGATTGGGLFEAGSVGREAQGTSIAAGITTYYGDQLASRIGQNLLGTRVEYRPVLLFGEANPEAKLVVSQDLSQHIGLAVAFDLSESDERIYLIDLHGFSFLPSLSGTVFQDSNSEFGATVQQQFDFGGGVPPEEEDLPLLDDLIVQCEVCAKGGARHELVDLGDIRRAAGYREDDPIASGTDFDVEVEVAEMLRRRGFPDPTVEADVEPDDEGFVDLLVKVEPGPYAEFRFTGEKPSKLRRESIRSLYRVDYYEPTSIREVEERTLRAWQARGHPEPEVSVEVEELDPDDPRSDRIVTVHSRPGRKLEIQEIRLRTTEGSVDTELERAVLGRFESPLWRVRLATAEESSERRLREILASYGYPEAEVVRHELRDDAEVVVVELDLGRRKTIGDLAFRGLEEIGDELASAARESVEIASGDPLVSPRIARAAVELERHLRSRGFYEARVHSEIRPRVTAEGETDSFTSDVTLIAQPGRRFVLHGIEFRGTETTEESWLRKIVGLEPGTPLDRGRVGEARRELVQTGLFERVLVETDHREEGTVLIFDIVEKHRWDVGYGLRWTGDSGFGVVGDVADRNLGGRGIQLGLRALLGTEESRARVYSRLPRLFGRDLELELFSEYFEAETRGVEESGWILSSQLSTPLRENLEGRIYVRLRDDEILVPVNPEDPEIEERTPLAGIQLVWDDRDAPLDPHRGFLASIDLSGSSDVFGGDRPYLRLYTQLGAFLPFAERYDGTAWVWAQSLRVGIAEADDGLPALVRFFAGGPLSVRGYRERNLGPQIVLDNGKSVARGGEASFILNEELRIPLPWFEGYQGVVFFDAGQVWAEAEDARLQDLLYSAGFGIRGNTPVGLLRLDVAFPLDQRPQDDSVEFYFGFGHAF